MLIVFIGPDGCGKTTVATRVRDHLEANGTQVHFFEKNYGVLPRFRDMASFALRRKVGKTHEPGEYMAGMKNRPNSLAKGTFYMVWYSLDYLIGRFKYRSSAQGQSVIFARYAYDYGFQRAYSRVPHWVLQFMLFLAPSPDYVFTIDRDGAEIFAGKPELTVDEINRQQVSIRSLLAGKPYFHVLDGTQGVAATVDKAIAIISGQAST